MTKREFHKTGTILTTRKADSGDHEISAAISLPQSVWEKILDDADDLRLPFFAPRSTLPLRERITEFLECQAQVWTIESQRVWHFATADDLDDDVPF